MVSFERPAARRLAAAAGFEPQGSGGGDGAEDASRPDAEAVDPPYEREALSSALSTEDRARPDAEAVDPQYEREALSSALSTALPQHLLDMMHFVEVLAPRVISGEQAAASGELWASQGTSAEHVRLFLLEWLDCIPYHACRSS